MDATEDAAATASQEEAQRTTIRRLAWTLAWGLPAIALIVGISLTNTGAIEQWTPAGDDSYDVTMLAVWPAGLVLLAVGALGLIASALTTVVLTTKR
ncbi:hypothetical protein ACI2IP_05140 [Microbacterium sp. NPDC090218]